MINEKGANPEAGTPCDRLPGERKKPDPHFTPDTQRQARRYPVALLNRPPVTDWLTPADEFCVEPAPIRWLVKHWLQEGALIMVHGPSGGGKTFVVLDWSLHIAAGLNEWHGHKVKPGPVVYLAGEGHYGIKRRLAAWAAHYRPEDINLWVSKTGCDLNTPEGYSRVLEAVRGVGEAPSLIVVDTVHRFMHGDENSAQDVRTMIQAADGLKEEFGCTVILVHHTGVSDEAQHRARGSSAWKGALEIEISVVPAKGDTPIQIVQRKSKDAEEAKPVYVTLQTVPIKGWLDDDGEQVTSAVLMPAEGPISTEYQEMLEMAAIRVLEATSLLLTEGRNMLGQRAAT